MHAPSLTPDEADEIVGELADALDEMLACTCADMGPLWLDATREPRTYLGAHAIPDLDFTPSPRYSRLSKGARSKYRGLAAWRHAVLWRRVRDRLDAVFGSAMTAMYFSPFPANEPPYAWSRSATEVPKHERFESPTTLKNHAKEGCWESVRLLRRERRELEPGAWADGVRALLLRPGTRDSLRDELKLELHPAWERDG